MQISTNYSNSTTQTSNSSKLEEISKNLDFQERKTLREMLLKVPTKDIPKVLNEITQIPVDENYFNSVLKKVEEAQKNNPQGFVIYA